MSQNVTSVTNVTTSQRKNVTVPKDKHKSGKKEEKKEKKPASKQGGGKKSPIKSRCVNSEGKLYSNFVFGNEFILCGPFIYVINFPHFPTFCHTF